jgi:hypothetical protein
MCRQEVEFLYVTTGGTYSNNWALEFRIIIKIKHNPSVGNEKFKMCQGMYEVG